MARPVVHRGGQRVRQPDLGRTLAELDATGWELYHVDEDPAENHDLAAEHRAKLIALIATWYVEAGKYGVMPIDGSGLARMIAEKPMVPCPATATSTGRTPSRSRSSPAPGCSTGRTASPPTSRSPTAAPRACCSCQGSAAGGYSLSSRTATSATSTTRSAGPVTWSYVRPSRADRHATSSGSSSNRPAQPDMSARQGRARAAPALRRRRTRRRRRRPDDHPVHAEPRRADLRRQRRLAGHDDYASPFRFTGTVTVTVDVSGELILDPEAELRAHMARQ